ncbi:MAG: hypothetical protein HY769_02630 [Candidatus Stahlbacteria bacterium]|nr:hypothetical protein [Candidatus Stahlbacteria bacterium]
MKKLLLPLLIVACFAVNGVWAAAVDSVKVPVKFSLTTVKEMLLDSVSDYHATNPGNRVLSADDTVGFGTLEPGITYHIGSTNGTATLYMRVFANTSWELKTMGTGNFSDGSNTIPLSRLEWAEDGAAQTFTGFSTTEASTKTGSASTTLRYDYRTALQWTDTPGNNYKTDTYWKLY